MSGTSHPAPVWRAVTGAIPLRAWRDEDFDRLARLLGAALVAWAQDWELPARAAGPVMCAEAAGHVRREGDWQLFARGEAGSAWMVAAAPGAGHLPAGWLEPGEAHTSLLEDLAASCASDARSRLATVLQLEPAAGEDGPAERLWSPWSGAVIAELPDSFMLVEAEVLHHLLRPQTRPASRGPVVAVGHAMAHRSLRVQVELQGCELPLGELAGLRLGDVLRLRHPVDAPERVRHATAGVLFDGWLARSRGRRAIELAPHAASHPEEQR